jgi:hypothetical protein
MILCDETLYIHNNKNVTLTFVSSNSCKKIHMYAFSPANPFPTYDNVDLTNYIREYHKVHVSNLINKGCFF